MEQRTFFRAAVRQLAEEHGIAFEDQAAVRRLMKRHRNALISHKRQLCFEVGGKRYKVRYNHHIGKRGGIEFVEIKALPGQPEIGVVGAIHNLSDAATFFRRPRLKNSN